MPCSRGSSRIAVGILGLLYVGLSRYFARALARHGEAANRHYERQVRILQDSSGAIRDLLVEGGQQAFVDAFARSSEAVLAARRGTDFLGNAPRFLIEAIGAIALAAIVVGASGQPGGIDSVDAVLAGRRVDNEPGDFEDFQVLRDGRPADRQGSSELTNRAWMLDQPLKDRPPGRISQCRPAIRRISHH